MHPVPNFGHLIVSADMTQISVLVGLTQWPPDLEPEFLSDEEGVLPPELPLSGQVRFEPPSREPTRTLIYSKNNPDLRRVGTMLCCTVYIHTSDPGNPEQWTVFLPERQRTATITEQDALLYHHAVYTAGVRGLLDMFVKNLRKQGGLSDDITSEQNLYVSISQIEIYDVDSGMNIPALHLLRPTDSSAPFTLESRTYPLWLAHPGGLDSPVGQNSIQVHSSGLNPSSAASGLLDAFSHFIHQEIPKDHIPTEFECASCTSLAMLCEVTHLCRRLYFGSNRAHN